MLKTPDSESLHLADYFATDINSQGLLGLEIQAKIVSSRFRLFSSSSWLEVCQKHRIRNPRIVLMILHRLSAPEAFWGSRFRPKLFHGAFRLCSGILACPDVENTRVMISLAFGSAGNYCRKHFCRQTVPHTVVSACSFVLFEGQC